MSGRIDLGAPDFREQDIFRQPPNSAFVIGAWSALPAVEERTRGALARLERGLGEADAFALYMKDDADDIRRYYPVLSLTDNFTVPSHVHSGVPRLLMAVIDGGGVEITTGVKGDSGSFNFAGSIVAVELLAQPAGDCVVDIRKAPFGEFPPTVGDSICASSKPTLTSDLTYRDVSLTGWDTDIAIGDVFRVAIDSVSLVERLTVTLAISGSIT